MVAVAQLMLITASLADTQHVRRVAICQPIGAGEALEDVAPIAALDLDALHALVHARQVVEAADPLRGL